MMSQPPSLPDQLVLTDVSVFFRITDQRYERVPYFVFGDFNFRLDSKQVIEVSLSDNHPTDINL